QKVEIDSFSGYKIYPSKGRLFVCGDSKVFRFANGKNERVTLPAAQNPRKIAWTQVYRCMHKKGLAEEASKKRTRRTVKHQRGIVGADLAAIAACRNQTEIDRTKARQAAIARAKAERKDKESKKTRP
ncbi:60S ribosomal protein L24, partial [Phellopilus nigrolimitatus]